MQIQILIGPDAGLCQAVQQVLADKRNRLAAEGILVPRGLGTRNHTALFLAMTDSDAVDALRFHRGYASTDAQAALRADIRTRLHKAVSKAQPQSMILAAHQLGTGLITQEELHRLHAFLRPFSRDIRIRCLVDDPARMLLARYAAQLLDGRLRGLSLELSLLDAPNFRQAALNTRPARAPWPGLFPEIQSANAWLDTKGLVRFWESVFGRGAVTVHSCPSDAFCGDKATQTVRQLFGIDANIGKTQVDPQPAIPGPQTLSRWRRFNPLFLSYQALQGGVLPRADARNFYAEMRLPEPPADAGALHAVSERFAADLAALAVTHPGLSLADIAPEPPAASWQESDPGFGFRPTQYLCAFQGRLDRALRAARADRAPRKPGKPAQTLSETAEALLPARAKTRFASLLGSRFEPHNRPDAKTETLGPDALTPFEPRIPPPPQPETSGRVIVACMKNEAPYILEWVAYHKAIGFDTMLVYTNDCSDGTDAILARLDRLGHLHHRDNSRWQGRSPQQHALDLAPQEPVVRDAEWVAHIDVDEFVNVRCGNGTLDDLFAAMPGATHIAMTWRLFGHGGVDRFEDRFVIGQFTQAAPAYCPKPHTSWGFKTLFRPIGAYGRMSCHRPNKLNPGAAPRVRWVNGSGRDITDRTLRTGWRSTARTVGYELVQLNHYALRSIDSFLIKRQRGRALHVDRDIGLDYWVRMDWSDHRDLSIQRNLPRMRADLAPLMADDTLRALHDAGVRWHAEKARALRAQSEFAALRETVMALDLTATERVAYALALDPES
ncbi:glycosyltransferase family 2 protein [Cognatishimia sp. F0-27]|uniref:glycosyltransferase family 2 protein n=1 Tax=Cognatishimia sp. F0-27 TaxID=2816855 RepID=UPI001D0C3817|nr:glycosyltransferase family 2 protein [Cognatishimia sp. F0-27]MCC1493448.1 glycosyltransferase family 2 protein [Cognatishimia sp. F0-27]